MLEVEVIPYLVVTQQIKVGIMVKVVIFSIVGVTLKIMIEAIVQIAS